MVKGRHETKVAANGLGDGHQVGVVQIDDVPTNLANQVMVRHARQDLELCAPPPQIGLGEDAQITQPLQGPIDGGEIDVPALGQHPLLDLFCTGVTVQIAQGLQDEPSLGRHPQSILPEAIDQRLQV
jgi:hypothetical protein